MNNSISLANKILDCGDEFNYNLNLISVMKLQFICYGWCLAILNTRICIDHPEAWKYGPVFKKTYMTFKYCRNDIIKTRARDITTHENIVGEYTNNENTLIKKVVHVYGKIPSHRLSMLLTKENTPWHDSWNYLGGDKIYAFIIDDDLIKKYYIEEYHRSYMEKENIKVKEVSPKNNKTFIDKIRNWWSN